VRDGVEAEVLVGDVGEEVGRHRPHRGEVVLELGHAHAGDRELAARHDALALCGHGDQARVGEVEEEARHGGART
jgi:hypothetical protein